MSNNIKKWDGWKRVSRAEVENKKIIKPLDLSSKKIKSKDIVHGRIPKDTPKVPVKNVPRPIICQNCGFSVTNEDYFHLFTPLEKVICRGCHQNNIRCQNCNDPIEPNRFKKDVPFCKDCLKQHTCHCCKQPFSLENLERKKYIKGAYCSSCLDNSKSCIHCYRLISKQEIACSSCLSSSFLNNNEVESIISTVVHFYKNLDPYFKVSLRTKSFSLVKLSDTSEHPKLLETPLYIDFSTLYILESITTGELHYHLCFELVKNEVKSWKVFQSNKAFKKSFIAFSCLLYFENKKLSFLNNNINRGFYGKEFVVMNDLKEKIGYIEAYKKLKKQFDV